MSERDIFTAAREMTDPVARSAYLDGACGADTGLRSRVEALLRAHDRPDSLLDQPAVPPHDPNSTTTGTMGHDGGAATDDEVPLGFLAPATRPDSLGRIGHYEVLQVLGQGGFGIVFRAFDDVLQRVVAVKVLAPQLAATSPARKRFLREARSSAQVRHENVVQVYEVGEEPLPYIAMEFIPGETLQQRLDRVGPVAAVEVVRVGRQVAEGLAAAHATDLIHRDIKPGNILLEGGTQRVKITDFGLARAADDASISQSGLVAGTPMYMAPEQAKGETLDQRADLFSLGSVLYQMAAGRPPFRANGTLAVLKRVAEDDPRPIREVIPEAPEWLCDVIAKLHAKKPDDRFQSAREVADVLADCEAQLGANAKLTNFSRIPAGKSAPARSGRRKWTAAALALAIVLLLGGAWFGRAVMLYLSNRGELELLHQDGLVSVIVLQNDEGVIDENKLHAPVTDWLDMKKSQTLELPPGRYQLNVGSGPAGTHVSQWDITTSGPFGSHQVTVPVINSSAIVTIQRGERLTLRAVMRSGSQVRPSPSADAPNTLLTDPDRRAAEYVLSAHGVVKVDGQDREILAITDLPREPFRLTYADVRSVQLTDNGLASFKGCKNLVHLGLDVSTIDGPEGEVTDAGLAYFKDCKNLTSLSLNSRGVTDAGLAYFKDCKSLTGLSLIMSDRVTDAGLLHFKECKNLTSLSLNCAGVTGAGLVHFKDCKNLIDLNLYGTQISDAGGAAFAGCKNLKNLNLGYTRVTDAGVAHFKDCKNLIDLSLYHTQVGDAGIAAFRDCKNLKNLNLNETRVSGVGLAHLKDCKALRILQLGDSKITDAGLASLKNFEGLRNLTLWHTPVSDAGLALFAGLDNLTDLDLRYTKVTGRGLKGLAKVLPKCAITWDGGVIEPNGGSDRRAADYVLSVGGVVEINRDTEITALATLPKIVFRLTRVGLGNNPEVTDAGLAALKDCQNLAALDLTGTPVTDAGLAHLAGLSELTGLHLAKTKVTAKGVDGLARALPKCTITWDGGVIGPNSGSDRRAAEYVLSVGGFVRINEQEQPINAKADLPREPFRLTSVDLGFKEDSADDGLAVFKGCKNLVHLSLGAVHVFNSGPYTDEGLTNFKDCKGLTSLYLNSTGVTDAGLLPFKECKNLTVLSLQSIGITDAGLARIRGFNNLTQLDLSSTRLTDTGLGIFKGYTKLTHLRLAYTRVTDAGLVHFKDCKNLVDLDLRDTQVGDAGIATFKDCKGLKELTLSGTQVGDVGLAQLKDCNEMRVVDLGGSKVTDAGLAGLKNYKGLTKLDLGNTPVSDAGVTHLYGLDNLTDLNLNKTKVTAQGAKGLAKALPKCTITWDRDVIEPNGGSDRRAAEYVLSVGGVVGIDPGGEIKALAKLPRRVFRLTRVDLADNGKVRDAGLVAFKDCQNLTVLDLTGTPLTDAGLAHLAGLSELRNLLLAKTKVTAKGVEGLAKALPKCKITRDGGVIGPK